MYSRDSSGADPPTGRPGEGGTPGTAELVLLALAGLVIGILGALLPASWAARARTASALRAE